MFRYFGFGSNLSMTSLCAKGVEPLAARCAVLRGWRLRFNVQHFFRHEGGVGNIEFTNNPDDRVLGMLYDCPDRCLAPLDAAEAHGHGYDRITVDVEADGEVCPAFAYIGMPDFINNNCLPSQRYLNILVDGACSSALDPDYINDLKSHPVHPAEHYPKFAPPPGEHPIFNALSLAQYPLYTAIHGAVFDMSDARPLHEYLKGFFGGRDMTLFHIRRLDSSDGNESMEDIRLGRLNKAQLDYLNSYLNEYAREYRYVGHFQYE